MVIIKANKPDLPLVPSYRPISVVVTFSKPFEKILLRRKLPILEEWNILPEHQLGFRRGHGAPEMPTDC